MSNMADVNNTLCCTPPLERVRYFPRQLLTADDLCTEQAFLREKMRRRLRLLHGWGVVCGCAVEPVGDTSLQVRVQAGYAVSPLGDEIVIDTAVDVDLRLGVQAAPCAVAPCPPLAPAPAVRDGPVVAYVAARAAECYLRPVRVTPAGCGCDETACEYSRIRETFEVKVLWSLPASHTRAAQADAQWRHTLERLAKEKVFRGWPVPPCPTCPPDGWVVLASVVASQAGQPQPGQTGDAPLRVSYDDRRVLLSTQHLQAALAVLGT